MATALDIVKGAMRLVGALEAGATPSGEDSADALTALNDFLEQLSLDRLAVYQKLNEQFTWPSGVSSRTIGSGGQFSTTRPTRLEDGCFVRTADGSDWPLDPVDNSRYQEIIFKTLGSSIPSVIYYSPEMPLGKLYIWPVPAAAVTVSICSLKQFTAFTALADVVTLPPGYVRLLKTGLAVIMAPEWTGREASETVKEQAQSARAAVKRTNMRHPVVGLSRALRIRNPGTYNILKDGY